MKMYVIGAREAHGTSKKTNRPYDLTFVTAIHPDLQPGGFGKTSCSVILDSNQFPAQSIQLDNDYNVDFDPHGRCVAFVPVIRK